MFAFCEGFIKITKLLKFTKQVTKSMLQYILNSVSCIETSVI